MSDTCRKPQQPSATRRALLAAPLILAAAAHAQAPDESLTKVIRRGVLRVSIGFWTAEFVAEPGGGEPLMRDPFHAGMARLVAERLGLRAQMLMARQSGDGVSRLLDDEVDFVLPPPVTRSQLRRIMFCTPHLSMDLVLLSRGTRAADRRRSGLSGMRIATLNTLATALADRGSLDGLPEVTPIGTPLLLLQRLLNGALDGIIVTNVMARAMLRYAPEAGLRVQFVLASSVFAGAVAYGAHDLLRALNAILDELHLDGSLARLFRRETGLTLTRPDQN